MSRTQLERLAVLETQVGTILTTVEKISETQDEIRATLLVQKTERAIAKKHAGYVAAGVTAILNGAGWLILNRNNLPLVG